MNADELAALEKEADQLDILTSPALFAQVISRQYADPWTPYPWLEYVNERLLKLVAGEGKNRLLLTAPPRHGKSQLCSIYLPAWFLNRHPSKRVILCAYGDDFAMEWGRKVRDLIQSNRSLLQIEIDDASKAADRWDLRGKTGGMKTAGAGGQIVGRGAHLLIIDDPIKDAAEASSATIREQKWEWWRTTVQSRLEPGAVVVLMHQRWHEDDLAGRILEHEGDKWDVVNFPAIAEEEDVLGRMPGEALCPERFNENALANIRESMGVVGFSALYQQHPQPAGGGSFKKSDFRYYTLPAAEHKQYALRDDDGTLLVPQSECWRFITMDLALTAKQTSDYTVAAVWDVAPWLEPTRLILVHVERVRIEGAKHIDMVKRLWDTWKPSFVGIEEAMQGSMTMAASQRVGVLVRPLRHKNKDKVFRAKDAELLVENHRVYFPKTAEWLSAFEHELLVFPTGTHDDQVDVFAYAATQILRNLNMAKPVVKPWEPESLEERVDKWRRTRDHQTHDHPVLGRIR
jgi:predicted phage terminase large subunit-like protein